MSAKGDEHAFNDDGVAVEGYQKSNDANHLRLGGSVASFALLSSWRYVHAT